MLLVAGGGDPGRRLQPGLGYRLETYLGELTYPGEPRRTAVTASESRRFHKADSLYSFLHIVRIIRIVSADVEGIAPRLKKT